MEGISASFLPLKRKRDSLPACQTYCVKVSHLPTLSTLSLWKTGKNSLPFALPVPPTLTLELLLLRRLQPRTILRYSAFWHISVLCLAASRSSEARKTGNSSRFPARLKSFYGSTRTSLLNCTRERATTSAFVIGLKLGERAILWWCCHTERSNRDLECWYGPKY